MTQTGPGGQGDFTFIWRRMVSVAMNNTEIAVVLEELADLNELDGAVVYRVVAYREAARAVRESAVAVEQLAEQGRLTSLPGVGRTIEEKINTLLATGEIPAATKL